MTYMYRILSIAGWAWLVVVAVLIVVRLTMLRRKTRRLDVVVAPAATNEGTARETDPPRP